MVLVSWRVDRVGLVPGGGEWKVRPPSRVNKVRLSPSPGAASGGAMVRAAVIYLCASAGGFLPRRSVDRAGSSPCVLAAQVLVLRFVLFILPPAGRGGEGRRWCWRAFRFWWWFCWRSSSTSLLRQAVVARGGGVGKLCGDDGGRPGRRRVGGKHGGSGELVLWPSVFIGFGSAAGRRTAQAVFYKVWRCSFSGGRRFGDSGEA